MEMKRKPFQIWEVDGEEYRLKLKTATIIKLEEKYKTSLINLIQVGENLPPLNIMLDITHSAMKDWNNSIKLADVYGIFDKYCEEGGSQLDFYQEVYIGIFTASGFFTNSIAKEMEMSKAQMEEE